MRGAHARRCRLATAWAAPKSAICSPRPEPKRGQHGERRERPGRDRRLGAHATTPGERRGGSFRVDYLAPDAVWVLWRQLPLLTTADRCGATLVSERRLTAPPTGISLEVSSVPRIAVGAEGRPYPTSSVVRPLSNRQQSAGSGQRDASRSQAEGLGAGATERHTCRARGDRASGPGPSIHRQRLRRRRATGDSL